MSIEINGWVAPGFEPVSEAMRENFARGEETGAAFAVYRDGEPLVDIWAGQAGRTAEEPWTRDTVACVYSTSKAISALVVARLAGDGELDYEDPVSKLWPEFAAEGKGALTIGQAISHQAGLCGFPFEIDKGLWFDPPALADMLARMKPLWEPGTASGYHPLTWGYIVGEIVRRATGQSLGEILREDITGPLEIDFHYGLPEAEMKRNAAMKKPSRAANLGEINELKTAAFLTPWSAPLRNDPRYYATEIPSANGHGTARAIAKLYAAYACDGNIDGAQILSPMAYAELTKPRIKGPDLVLPFDLDWRAGVLGNAQGFYGPNTDALGHSGFGGSCGFGDPATRISVGYVMNKQAQYLMGDPRALRLIEALYACV